MMKSIMLLALANLKKRPLVTFLLGITIVLSELLLFTTLSINNSLEAPYDALFDQLHTSHILIYYDQQQQSEQRLVEWLSTQPEVAAVNHTPMPYYTPSESLIFKEKELELDIQLTEHAAGNLVQDRVLINQGESKVHPGPAEIWIPHHLAQTHNIAIGDTMGIPVSSGLFPVIVSAIVIDPSYASGLFNPTRAWVASGSLALWFPISSLNGRIIGVRLHDHRDTDLIWTRFNRHFQFDGHHLTYSLFKSVYLSIYQILLAVLMLFSLLGIIASALIFAQTISVAIAAEYRSIGIYKTIGLTPSNLFTLYLVQFGVLTCLSLPPGIGGGIMISHLGNTLIRKSLGVPPETISWWSPAIITALIFMAIVLLITLLTTRKAMHIRPVRAIRYGASSLHTIHISFRHLVAKIPVTWFMGLKMMVANPRRLLSTSVMCIGTLFLMMFVINVGHSLVALKENRTAWGFEDSDLQVIRRSKVALPIDHAQLIALLKSDSLIQSVIAYSFCHAQIPAQENRSHTDLQGKVYDDSINLLGLTTLDGHYPTRPNEIALCIQTAAEFGMKTGDSIQLFIEGQENQFLITGIYQDISNLGHGFRLHSSAMYRLNPLFKPDLYAIKLHQGVDITRYRSKIEKTLGEAISTELSVEERKQVRQTLVQMQLTLYIIGSFFLLILVSVIITDTQLNLYAFTYVFGILSALGMTPIQIRQILLIRMLYITTACLLIATPVSLKLIAGITSVITKGIGLEMFPLQVHKSGMLLLVLAMPVLSGLIVWLSTSNLRQYRPQLSQVE